MALGAAGGCGSSTAPPAHLRAVVTRAPKDTVRFEAAATAARCGRANLGLVIDGSTGGNGVLIWLRPAGPLAPGEFSLLARADTSAARGAVVAVRFMVGDIAHGVTLDSGAVAVTRTSPTLAARVRGTGQEAVIPGRVALDATFEAVPLGTDTVPCQARP